MAPPRVVVTAEPVEPAAVLAGFAAGRRDVGAVVSFTGLVRDEGGRLEALEIEHYPGMTEARIDAIAAEAMVRWALSDCLVIHRHGRVAAGAPIMMVATAAPHRRAAFEAADFLMDYLKSRAPFWKKEIGAGGARWVEARATDEDALSRW